MKPGKYSIETTIYVDRNATLKGHIPYHLCSVVVGPKGGRYVLDTFCMEYLIKRVTAKTTIVLSDVLRKLVMQKIIGYTAMDLKDTSMSSDQLVREVARKLNAKALIRLEGKEVLDNVILKNFYADDLKAI